MFARVPPSLQYFTGVCIVFRTHFFAYLTKCELRTLRDKQMSSSDIHTTQWSNYKFVISLRILFYGSMFVWTSLDHLCVQTYWLSVLSSFVATNDMILSNHCKIYLPHGWIIVEKLKPKPKYNLHTHHTRRESKSARANRKFYQIVED